MRKKAFHFFAGLFSAKSSIEKAGSSADEDVITTASAQPHILRERMKEAQLTHGETVIVNISPVRLEAAAGKMAIYFCPMKYIEIYQKIAAGDGGDIPYEVSVEGLKVPPAFKSGLYTLKN